MNPRLLRCLALLLLAGPVPFLRAADPAPAVEDKITLPKFQVKGTAICSYGIGVTAVWNRESQHIVHLYVTDVTVGSVADNLGLQPGDEILTLNGRKVTDLKAGMKRGSDLFDLLVDQPPGRKIEVEVAMRVVKRVALVATP